MSWRQTHIVLFFSSSLLLAPAFALASATTQPDQSVSDQSDLTNLSLEDLMNVQVTSVAKAPQKIADAPAAVTVIGQDDIQRSGLYSIPELLRLAPGMDVAQVDANHWAITSRGFNDIFADDLLVLMDGRSVYTPVFGGVTWDTVNYPLEDLDRIEVIRGPGSTLWGSNAVNGVVNIITKSARDTQGGLFDGRLGTSQSGAVAQYGGQIDDKTYYRVYDQYQYTNDNVTPTGDPAHDEAQLNQGGFRIDRYSDPKDTLTLEGDIYGEQFDYLTTPPPAGGAFTGYDNGGNINAKWMHTESDRSDTSIQMYYSHESRDNVPASYDQDQLDAEFQNRIPLGDSQEITWGLGARDTIATFQTPLPGLDTFDPRHRGEYILNGYVQDQITIVPNQLNWFVGTKVEYDNLTGTYPQPSTRLLWTPDDRNSFWAAISRSVRIPSMYQEADINLAGFQVNSLDPTVEKTMSYEIGYKTQLSKTVTMDVTGFYNDYHDLINLVGLNAFPPVVGYANIIQGQSFGTEYSANWQITPQWRISGSYSFVKVLAETQSSPLAPAVIPGETQFLEGNSPEQQFQLHSYLDVTKNVQFNASGYVVSPLPTVMEQGNLQRVPGYFRLDLNVVWHVNPNTDLSVGVQNLLQKRHPEFGNINTEIVASEAPRTVYAQCAMRF